jgi:Ssl1-like
MPSHTSREVLIIFGGLSTCDPGDITETIKVSFMYCYVQISVYCMRLFRDLNYRNC